MATIGGTPDPDPYFETDPYFEDSVVGIVNVGSDGRVLRANPAACVLLGYTEAEFQQLTWPDFTAAEDVARLRDHFAEAVAIPLEVRLKKKTGQRFPVAVNVQPPDAQGRYIAFLTDLSRLRRAERDLEAAAQHKSLLEMGIGSALGSAIEARDPYTSGHQDQVCVLSGRIADALGADANQREGAVQAAAVHDVGKIGVPAEFLSKATKLLPAEMDVIRGHAQIGYTILKELPTDYPIAEIVFQHHERMDGSGYPRGLKGDHICLEAMIVAVADTIDSIIRPRPYRAALGKPAVMAILNGDRGTKLPVDVVDAALAVVGGMS